jgi:hypothetical protein
VRLSLHNVISVKTNEFDIDTPGGRETMMEIVVETLDSFGTKDSFVCACYPVEKRKIDFDFHIHKTNQLKVAG